MKKSGVQIDMIILPSNTILNKIITSNDLCLIYPYFWNSFNGRSVHYDFFLSHTHIQTCV